jgi:hypothetical protein
MDEATVAKIHDFARSDLPDEVKVALEFAERWYLHHAQTIDDEMFAALRAHYDEAQIVELAIAVGSWELYHKFKMVFEIEAGSPDLRIRGDGRVPDDMRRHLDGLRVAEARAAASVGR